MSLIGLTMKKPRLLLLDANAVIAALESGTWQALLLAFTVILPSVVVRSELIYYVDRDSGRQIGIDATKWVEANEIVEVEMTAADLDATLRRFREPFVSQLDPGEAEAIAYLLSIDGDDDLRFVSADGWAIQAMVMLGMRDRLVCLSDVLSECGYGRKLPRHHERAFLTAKIQEGANRLVTKNGLV